MSVDYVLLTNLLGSVDYIISLLPDTKDTRGLLNGDVLSACAPRQAVLINAGRGTLLTEDAAVQALNAGYIRHYVADVYVEEPLPKTSPLWHHPRVTCTPHVAAITQPQDVAECFKANLLRYTNGDKLLYPFDTARQY